MWFRRQLDRMEAKLDKLITQEAKDMAALDDELTALESKATNIEGAADSAVVILNKIPQMIQTAVAAALAAGATPAQLQAVIDLGTALDAHATPLAAAVAAAPTS